MKQNFAAMSCNFIAALAWVIASVLYFMQGNQVNGIVFLMLTFAQTGLALMNMSAYRRAKAQQAEEKSENTEGND